jgi:hypothetical protein
VLVFTAKRPHPKGKKTWSLALRKSDPLVLGRSDPVQEQD